MCGRLGGAEFSAVLPDAQSMQLSLRLRRNAKAAMRWKRIARPGANENDSREQMGCSEAIPRVAGPVGSGEFVIRTRGLTRSDLAAGTGRGRSLLVCNALVEGGTDEHLFRRQQLITNIP
ncbi:hypothetical protein [Amycolatopsis sp. FU40]|uniref:hypothetical protein n=1 Tax=Amycolatopsis sp. FU40 TaxID=2914159 RepID=UPI00351CEC79